MNIFSNNCTNGFIYKYLFTEQMKNPLYWSGMTEYDFVKFCKYFNTIDFNDYKLIDYTDTRYALHNDIYYCHDDNNKLITDMPAIQYKNDIQVIFPHYINNFQEIYEKRLNRYDKTEDILFILNTYSYNTSENIINDFINLKTPYKKVLITDNYKYTRKRNTKNLLIINTNTYIKYSAKPISKIIKIYYNL